MEDVKVIKRSSWVDQIMRNKKARERYHLKKYGNLDRLLKKEIDLQKKYDEIASRIEYEETK